MLCDELYSFYRKSVSDFERDFQEVFGENLVLKDKCCSFEHRGYFKLHYVYVPLNYAIIVENEFRTFGIVIEDEEKAMTSLYRIEHFENQLSEGNIIKSIKLLEKVLSENKFDLFLHIAGKTYRKNKNGLKRVKDIKELM
nr:hypothetical protein [Eubacterium sp.]